MKEDKHRKEKKSKLEVTRTIRREKNFYIKLSLTSPQRDYRNGQSENKPALGIQK